MTSPLSNVVQQDPLGKRRTPGARYRFSVGEERLLISGLGVDRLAQVLGPP
jgi:hypothetical protein